MPPYIAPYTLHLIREEFAILYVYCSVDGSVSSVIDLRFLYYLCSVVSPWNSVYICMYCM